MLLVGQLWPLPPRRQQPPHPTRLGFVQHLECCPFQPQWHPLVRLAKVLESLPICMDQLESALENMTQDVS